ncbi:hypothetical protein FNT36_16760 [Hymenobacter setariae]|uniref:Uncharacterized protein n=1 Tax=Hymenobacter setariae TaxID=2594794 RepID=A0A558BS08_9BACT|nr:hypothetical protein [Hymenobacter setariae]TVT39306.1 hypothetical protein FNT36_16760 [Hymenobacter setariae]
MAYTRKPLTVRYCQQCHEPYEAVDRRCLYCRPGCKTAASNARRAAATARRKAASQALASPSPLGQLTPEPETALPAAPAGPGFGKLTLASAAGNLLAEAVKSMWSPKATTTGPPAGGWPTWPPAELLATTGPGELFHDPSWEKPLVLTPVTYHQHQLYLCVEEGLTVVLRQPSPGCWQYVRTLDELALLAAQPPLSGIQALLARSQETDPHA